MPTVTTRPTGTVQNNGGVVVGGAGSIHAATSDNTDVTYVEATPAHYFVVWLGVPTKPATAMWKTFVARMRARCGAGNRWIGVYLNAVDGTPTTSTFYVSAAFADYTGSPLAYSGETLAPFAMVDIWNDGSGTTGRVSELYLDSTYAEQPTTAVSAPSGTIIDRTTVDVVWSHTAGADGGSQQRYRVKVFSAAQYGAPGFNPESSAATFDSGDTASTTSTISTTTLANDSYRAYVKTAQSVNGIAHWADWVFTAFVIDVDTPELLSLVATPDDDWARVRLVAEHDTSTTLDWQTLDVEASYDGGTTWQAIYGGQSIPVGVFNTWIGYDYEAPNGVTAVYRARASAVVTGQTITGSYVMSGTTAWVSDTIWLKHLSNPLLSLTPCLRELPNGESFAISQGVHAVLGRPGYVVTSDVMHTRTGRLVMLTETTAERDEMHALLSDGTPLLLQVPESAGGFENIYLVVGGVDRSRVPGGALAALPHRIHSVPFVEIDRPLLDIAPGSFGESFADSVALGGTFADDLAAGGTFEELI